MHDGRGECDSRRKILVCPGRDKTAVPRFVRHLAASWGDPGLIVQARIDKSQGPISRGRESSFRMRRRHSTSFTSRVGKRGPGQGSTRGAEALSVGSEEHAYRSSEEGEALPEWQAALVPALSKKQLKTARAREIKEKLRQMLGTRYSSRVAEEIAPRIRLGRALRSRIEGACRRIANVTTSPCGMDSGGPPVRMRKRDGRRARIGDQEARMDLQS